MRALSALCIPVCFAGCVHVGTPAGIPRVAPATPVAQVVQAPQVSGSSARCTSDSQALSYACEQMSRLAPRISFTLSGENTYDRAYAMADTLLRGGAAVSFGISTRGNEVMLLPTYADNEVLLQAHRSPDARAALSDRQRRALAEAERVVRDVCSHCASDYERALALHDYLVLKCSYKESLQGHDSANATVRLFDTGFGVCDSYTRAYRLMLNMAGIENMFVSGVAQGENHCWNLVKLQGSWVHVDCTYSDPMPDEAGRICHTHFALPDTIIAHDHSWNRANYPQATAEHLYFPLRYARFATVNELVAWAAYYRESAQSPFITAYVDELNRMGHNRDGAQRLIEYAHMVVGEHVICNFALEEYLPGVIVCKTMPR